MIRKIATLVAVAAALAVAPAALAAEKSTRIGIGIAVEPTQTTGLPVSVHVPIDFGQLRIEPFLGFTTYSQDALFADRTGTFSSQSTFQLGAGVLYFVVPPSPFGIYAGGRLSLAFFSQEYPVTNPGPNNVVKWSETDVRVVAALGGEYFIGQRFSVAAEAQLGPTFYGNPSITYQPPTTLPLPNRGASSWNTHGQIFFRYFF